MADPGQGSFNDPAFWQHLETGDIVALDDLELPLAGPRSHRCHNRPLIAAIGENHLDEREQPAGFPEQFFGTIAVLHIGRVNHDPQHQAERINQDVPLAAGDLLAGVIPLRIDRGPLYGMARPSPSRCSGRQPEVEAMDVQILGVDLGKNSCSAVGLDAAGRVVLRRRMRRESIIVVREEA